MISIYEAAKVFSQHAREIARAARMAPAGWRILAEVDADGRWRGVGRVTPGTGSLLAHEGRGYALYISATPRLRVADVEDEILRWAEEAQARADARAEAEASWLAY